jgi:predicted ferric reductase
MNMFPNNLDHVHRDSGVSELEDQQGLHMPEPSMNPEREGGRVTFTNKQQARQGAPVADQAVTPGQTLPYEHDDEVHELASKVEVQLKSSLRHNARRTVTNSGLRAVFNEILTEINSTDDGQHAPQSHPVFDVSTNRRASNASVLSALSHLDDEQFSEDEQASPDRTTLKAGTIGRRKSSLITWDKGKSKPNQPHPALEYPPLYFLVRRFPQLLEPTKAIFRSRWRLSYQLQRSIPFSRTIFQKLNLFPTLGELLLIIPFIVTLVFCTVYSFARPDVSISGQTARTPLIFAFITATRNSPLTLIFGIPVDRAIWYHKLCARLAYVNGLLHTYVSFVYPKSVGIPALPPPTSIVGSDPDFGHFLFTDKVNSGGTMLLVFMTLMIVTALPFVRRRAFEVFYYLHVTFAATMVVCAFFHTGILVPTLVALTWGVDLAIRKGYMAYCRYPRNASVRIISESVVEVCFPKADGFDYNPGQYIYIAIPELSVCEWHPFSLSSSPEQKIVTLHIRKAGDWTSALYDLATKQMEVSILLEGPYGSVGVDLASDRYKMVMLFSGGIGATPMQALCNQLMYEQSTGVRELKKLSFVWIERDPNAMNKVDVFRRKAEGNGDTAVTDVELGLQALLEDDGRRRSIGTILLTLVPPSGISNRQLQEDYPLSVFDGDNSYNLSNSSLDEPNKNIISPSRNAGKNLAGEMSDNDGNDTVCQTILDAAYNGYGNEESQSQQDVLDLQVYLTARNAASAPLLALPFVHQGRPDMSEIFRKMREDALANDEHRVAVCVCAPERLVLICQKACVKYSDARVRFDVHTEVFG